MRTLWTQMDLERLIVEVLYGQNQSTSLRWDAEKIIERLDREGWLRDKPAFSE